MTHAAPAFATPPPNLQRLAAAELATPGRYHLSAASAAPQQPSLWTIFWQWVQDRWNDLWRAAFGHVHIGRGGAFVIGDVLIAAVAVLLIVVTLRLLAGLTLERRRLKKSVQLERAPDAASLYAAACEAARQGDLARGSALLFAAAVAALADRGAIRDDRCATVGELRRRLGAGGQDLVAPFDEIAAAFVAGAYAQRAVTASEWERARTSYASIAAKAVA